MPLLNDLDGMAKYTGSYYGGGIIFCPSKPWLFLILSKKITPARDAVRAGQGNSRRVYDDAVTEMAINDSVIVLQTLRLCNLREKK